MGHEIRTFVKIAVAAGGAAVALSGSPALLSSQDNNPTNVNHGTHTEWHIGACPPGFKAPWEYVAPSSKPTSLTGEITLVSVVPPQPTPNPYHVECWAPVQVPNTQENPGPDTTQQS